MEKVKSFFNNYFNIKNIMEQKKEYKKIQQRVKKLPEDYQYVFKELEKRIWLETEIFDEELKIIYEDILSMFENGIKNNQNVCDIVGKNIYEFIDDTIKSLSNNKSKKQEEKINKKIEKIINKK